MRFFFLKKKKEETAHGLDHKALLMVLYWLLKVAIILTMLLFGLR